MTTSYKKYLTLFLIAGPVVLFDQITKAMVMRLIPLYDTIAVIPGFFSLTHLRNQGGAFGFLANQSSLVRGFFFLFVSFVAIVVVLIFYKNTPRTHFFLSLALALVFGGAVGNMIDRLRFGEVVDFLLVYYQKFQWPAFNVADSAICVGVAIIIIHLVFNKMPD